MKVFILLLLLANLLYGGWHLLVGHPRQSAPVIPPPAGGENLVLIGELP